ncbi:hypothetical protein GQ43DRAFT_500642 [Delitschia confertaspora ATCC 74209]|uniref:Uncharacterized protein n=1 Tax=Delitschia confertaspora ATCC 74209 TaxID=1513339 RepID=A0A9P4JAI3_9PLEO|nr:hypothetical protein GQ43DRAFT_500642 [Delitschia confertaspora ATCC 74209]
MATLGLGLFLGGSVVAIPVVTGVAEGVQHQKKQNEEAANETRMIKFNLDVACENKSVKGAEDVDGGIVVLRHGKVWIVPADPETRTPISPQGHESLSPPLHPFSGFYIQYPDEDRCPPERGLVSTISDDPPMLNWIYCNSNTYALCYGNRTASISHIVGEWDWTDDESALTLDGFEGFVAVDEGEDEAGERDGLRWAVYFDRDDDGLGKGSRVGGKRMLEVELLRRVHSEEEQKRQLEEADKKMQVKTQGDLKSHFSAPARERQMR